MMISGVHGLICGPPEEKEMTEKVVKTVANITQPTLQSFMSIDEGV
jgi:hypothetical protein